MPKQVSIPSMRSSAGTMSKVAIDTSILKRYLAFAGIVIFTRSKCATIYRQLIMPQRKVSAPESTRLMIKLPTRAAFMSGSAVSTASV